MCEKLEIFIDKARKIHGDRYSYLNVRYSLANTPVTITCSKHGDFLQRPIVHLRGSGCTSCSHESRHLTTADVIPRYIKVHGDLYDYSLTNYINSDTKIDIICKVHGKFKQYPKDHENGAGCLHCGHPNKYTTETFIEKAKQIHGDFYDYTNAVYMRNNIRTEIICPVHGSFEQTPSGHLAGYGCLQCGRIKANTNSTKTTEQYVNEARQVHGELYDYTATAYVHSTEKLEIICKVHGRFMQSANNHLQGHGCPACAKVNFQSKPEFEIKEFIESLGIDVLHTHYLDGVELDLFVPSKNLAIEFNGLFYHSSGSISTDKVISEKHIKKTELCEKHGITLLHIFENEWENKQSIWKSMIKHRLGLSTKIYGRKTTCRDITSKLADEFCKINHMQGAAKSKYQYGLYYENILVAVISIAGSRYNDNDFEIIRYCNITDHNVVGGFSKLLKYFRGIHPGSIVSYANRRWSSGNLYAQSGFIKERITGPCYYYLKGDKMQHRSIFMKHKLSKLLDVFDASKTEVANMYENKYRRIWDCGTIVYTFNDK